MEKYSKTLTYGYHLYNKGVAVCTGGAVVVYRTCVGTRGAQVKGLYRRFRGNRL